MLTLSPSHRRDLRARAHSLHPVVAIGHAGLTPAVLKEIDVALKAHELVKVRVHSDDRDEREAFLGQVCEALAAGPVQHLGKLLIVWRPKPPEERERPRARPSSMRRREERKPAPSGRGGAEPQIGVRARKHRRGAARHEPPFAPTGKAGPRASRRRMTGGLAIPSAMREEPAPPERRPRGDARPPSTGKRPSASGKRPSSTGKRPPSSGKRPPAGAKHGAPSSVQRRRRTGGR